jgi:hypothetical protein
LPFKETFVTASSFRDIFSGSSALQMISFPNVATYGPKPTRLSLAGRGDRKKNKAVKERT